MPPLPDPAELLELACSAARQAGALLLDGLDRPRRTVETKSSATDMVSEMDRSSEALLRSVIAAERPADTFVGEEGGQQGGDPGEAGVRWIVDPLDGTTNYLYGFPAWSVSVAAEVVGEVVAGVVYDAQRDELFEAARGGGARLGDRVLVVREGASLSTALVATGFAYDPARRAEQGRWAAHVLPRVRDLRRAGSAALDLCWVAAGRVDAYYEQCTHEWDWAAGALIAAEAGAWVGGFDGGRPGAEGVVAAPPALAEPLLALVAEARGRPYP